MHANVLTVFKKQVRIISLARKQTPGCQDDSYHACKKAPAKLTVLYAWLYVASVIVAQHSA